MIKNYMIFPMKYMRVTQSYTGSTSHLRHTTGYPKDYPIDVAGKDTGRDAIYCPCDEMVVTAVKGYQNKSVTNTIWLVSTSPVVTPTFEDVAFMTLTHENDLDLKKIRVGDRFKRGEIICYEGTDGATSNHIHIVVGRGSSKNWEKNTTGAWVISGNTKKPEEVFFIDPDFTTVLSSGPLTFQEIPKKVVGVPEKRDEDSNQLEVLVDNLRARESPSLSAFITGFIQRGIYTYREQIKADGYIWYKVQDFWIAYQNNWINLYPKKEVIPAISEKPTEGMPFPSVEEKPVLIFTAQESKYYKIYLDKGSKLYLLK